MAEQQHPAQSDKIIELLGEIKERVGEEECVFRGEPRMYKRITSSLYREQRLSSLSVTEVTGMLKGLQALYANEQAPIDGNEVLAQVRSELNNLMGNTEEGRKPEERLENIQKQDAINVKKRTGVIKSDSEALADIQHSGGQTNLIDFTESYLVALFFACWDDRHGNDEGCLIVLSKNGIKELSNDEDIPSERVFVRPLHDNRRALVQYSVMLHTPQGYIEYDDEKIKAKIKIDATLKPEILDYLKNFCNISDETLFPDTLGYVVSQKFRKPGSVGFNQYKEEKKDSDYEDTAG